MPLNLPLTYFCPILIIWGSRAFQQVQKGVPGASRSRVKRLEGVWKMTFFLYFRGVRLVFESFSTFFVFFSPKALETPCLIMTLIFFFSEFLGRGLFGPCRRPTISQCKLALHRCETGFGWSKRKRLLGYLCSKLSGPTKPVEISSYLAYPHKAGALNRFVLNHLGSSTARLWSGTSAKEAAIVNCDWTLNLIDL